MLRVDVKRRRRKLGLSGSGKTTKALPDYEKEQLVLNQMQNDLARHRGVKSTRERIAFETGTHLTKNFVSSVMFDHDPAGFAHRDPTSKKIHRVAKTNIGVNERWSADGHDKLAKIGFPIWAIVDDATGKWLGAWVVPMTTVWAMSLLIVSFLLSSQLVAFPYSSPRIAVRKQPLFMDWQMLSGIELFHPEYDLQELPAHVFLRSVHNISIERSWLNLRLNFGNTAVKAFFRGQDEGVYEPGNLQHGELCRWLWAKLLRQELQNFVALRNGSRTRTNKAKVGPSGMSRNEAYSIPSTWGGRDCLLPIDDHGGLIAELKQALGGDEILEFVSADFTRRADVAYINMNVRELTFTNVWAIFSSLLLVLYPAV
ncbi:hypothetical protein BDN72DRAFT_906048 [Pluteus cervinus]|uniref:Uncharacterized protein n=1 Tax=Pluteus cervinus TaxID=181527 RepID=A0ACD3A0L2_9AGAR|nr:hypothetical protein BDN72DRAFT_906048 [Pluteus cervinus]